MTKPGLGRGLGKLLGRASEAPEGQPEPVAENDDRQKTLPLRIVSPGMEALLRTGREGRENPAEELVLQVETAPTPEPATPAPRSKLWIPLVLADVILTCEAVAIVRRSNGSLTRFEILLLVLALGGGAWLSCLAVLRQER